MIWLSAINKHTLLRDFKFNLRGGQLASPGTNSNGVLLFAYPVL